MSVMVMLELLDISPASFCLSLFFRSFRDGQPAESVRMLQTHAEDIVQALMPLSQQKGGQVLFKRSGL